MNANRLTASVTLAALLAAGFVAATAEAAEPAHVVIVHRASEAPAPGHLPRVELTVVRVTPQQLAARQLPCVEVVGRSTVPSSTQVAQRGARANAAGG
jgi:hypothetical protein